MGHKTDRIIGRAKQALGAVTGNEKMKREGQRQEAEASSSASSTQPSARHKQAKGPKGQGRQKLNDPARQTAILQPPQCTRGRSEVPIAGVVGLTWPSGYETRSAASGGRRGTGAGRRNGCVDLGNDRRGVISRREYGVRSGGRRDSRLGDAASAASRVRGRRHRACRDPRRGRRFLCGHRLDHQPRWGTRVSRRFRFDARATRLAAQRRP
jgi:hypothetical protein